MRTLILCTFFVLSQCGGQNTTFRLTTLNERLTLALNNLCERQETDKINDVLAPIYSYREETFKFMITNNFGVFDGEISMEEGFYSHDDLSYYTKIWTKKKGKEIDTLITSKDGTSIYLSIVQTKELPLRDNNQTSSCNIDYADFFGVRKFYCHTVINDNNVTVDRVMIE